MTLAVAVAVDGVRLPLGRERAAEIARAVLRAEKVRDAMLSIAFVGPRAIAELNFEHLGHAEPTDVISFGFAPTGGHEGLVGDVYICPSVAAENARDRGVPVTEELARLVVHGTLHVLGHDHPEGEDRTASDMWKRQERLLARALAAGARKPVTTKTATRQSSSAKKSAAKRSSARKSPAKKGATKRSAERRAPRAESRKR